MYISDDCYKQESKHLFQENWFAIGFAKDVPKSSDTYPIDILGLPLLLLRDSAGQIRIFENVCRHRGMILVDSPRNFAGVIRCPYHFLCYSQDGRLRATRKVLKACAFPLSWTARPTVFMTGWQAALQDDLDKALQDAHRRGDAAARSTLNQRVAEISQGKGEQRFALTQASVFALVAGVEVKNLEAALKSLKAL